MTKHIESSDRKNMKYIAHLRHQPTHKWNENRKPGKLLHKGCCHLHWNVKQWNPKKNTRKLRKRKKYQRAPVTHISEKRMDRNFSRALDCGIKHWPNYLIFKVFFS